MIHMVYLLTPQREIRFVCFYEIVDLNKFRACVSKSDRLSSNKLFSSEYSNIFNVAFPTSCVQNFKSNLHSVDVH